MNSSLSNSKYYNLATALFDCNTINEYEDVDETFKYVLSTLHPRTAKVLKLRYIEKKSFGVIGKLIYLSPERARQIAVQGINELRGYPNCKYIMLGKSNVDKMPKDGSDSVDILNLTNRTMKALYREGIKTISDLTKYSISELDDVYGIGEFAINEITRSLKARGLSLRE